MQKISQYLSLIFLCLGLGYFFYTLFDTGKLRFNYPSFKNYPIQGIDISHHQGSIDWKALRAENLSFIFIKATEGGDFKDPLFVKNWKNAKAEKYAVGAYHFYRTCTDWKEQAQNFIHIVPKEASNLPAVIDLEFMGNCESDKNVTQVRQEIKNLSLSLAQFYQKKPLLYVTQDFYTKYLHGYFETSELWYRNIFMKPRLEKNRKWIFWQFTNRGHLEGIKGYVDINVFYAGKKRWKAYLKTAF